MAGGGVILTLDGPASSGKSTLARAVAGRLGWAVLDSGLCYRLAGHLDGPLPPDASFETHLARCGLRFDGTSVWEGERDLTPLLRTEEADASSSLVAQDPTVRDILKPFFRRFAETIPLPGLVAEGRDMGTVVFPEAPKKIYLTADESVRMARRERERGVPDPHLSVRDREDAGRAIDPLRPADGAYLLDTTRLGIDEATQAVLDFLDE